MHQDKVLVKLTKTVDKTFAHFYSFECTELNLGKNIAYKFAKLKWAMFRQLDECIGCNQVALRLVTGTVSLVLVITFVTCLNTTLPNEIGYGVQEHTPLLEVDCSTIALYSTWFANQLMHLVHSLSIAHFKLI